MDILFTDRKQAANELLPLLNSIIRNDVENLCVLAIPRGGVIIGDVIASYFHCNLDIVVSRKIGAESNPELAIGAVMPSMKKENKQDNNYFINERVMNALSHISQKYIDEQIKIEEMEIERRLIEFRGSKDYGAKLYNKNIILVDDGIATGSTILASALWIRNNHNCKSLIVSSPVAPKDNDNIINTLKKVADKVAILYTIKDFSGVGQFYKNFDQIGDHQVKEIMKKYGYNIKT